MSLINYEKITIKRREVGKYINGFFVKGEETSFTAYASIQPLTGSEMQQLPEGDKLKDWQRIYCKTEILNNDVVETASGIEYEIRRIEGWRHLSMGGLMHTKGYMTRLGT
jgi:hypothetical protein